MCPNNFDVLDCGLWRTGFGLRSRRKSTSHSLPPDSKRLCLMLQKSNCVMSPYERHETESSCAPILWLPGNYEWALYGVFYEVDALESDLVNVLAIGVKRGNRLIVAGKEIHI